MSEAEGGGRDGGGSLSVVPSRVPRVAHACIALPIMVSLVVHDPAFVVCLPGHLGGDRADPTAPHAAPGAARALEAVTLFAVSCRSPSSNDETEQGL